MLIKADQLPLLCRSTNVGFILLGKQQCFQHSNLSLFKSKSVKEGFAHNVLFMVNVADVNAVNRPEKNRNRFFSVFFVYFLRRGVLGWRILLVVWKTTFIKDGMLEMTADFYRRLSRKESSQIHQLNFMSVFSLHFKKLLNKCAAIEKEFITTVDGLHEIKPKLLR